MAASVPAIANTMPAVIRWKEEEKMRREVMSFLRGVHWHPGLAGDMKLLATISQYCAILDLEAPATLGHGCQILFLPSFFLSFFLSSSYLYGYETVKFNGPDDLVIKHSLIFLSFLHGLGEVLLLVPSPPPPCAKLTLTRFLSADSPFPSASLFHIVRCYSQTVLALKLSTVC